MRSVGGGAFNAAVGARASGVATAAGAAAAAADRTRVALEAHAQWFERFRTETLRTSATRAGGGTAAVPVFTAAPASAGDAIAVAKSWNALKKPSAQWRAAPPIPSPAPGAQRPPIPSVPAVAAAAAIAPAAAAAVVATSA